MPIKKTSPGQMTDCGKTYVAAPSETIALLTPSPDAMAIWLYLMDKPANWVPRQTEVKNALCLSRRRYRQAMQFMRDVGLIEEEIQRNDQGHITDNIMTVFAIKPRVPESVLSDAPRVPVTGAPVLPTVGESAPINSTDYINSTDVKYGKKISVVEKDKKPSEMQNKSTRHRTLEEDLSDTSWAND